jgi:cyanuric acid amidohydrolase
MRDAGLASAAEVQFVQVKCPCVTSARAADALLRGVSPRTINPGRSMAYARAAGAFGVALALGERTEVELDELAMLEDLSIQSPRASVSSGVEVVCNEVIVLGNSSAWTGPLQVACHVMEDALDIAGIIGALAGVGIHPEPQASALDRARIRGVFVKCEPDRRGRIAGNRHTMLDDTDIDAQRHIRGALGGLVSGVIGDSRIFVSGGAEHQGPDGGGLLAVVAER